MNVHEYQAKALLVEVRGAHPASGKVAFTVEEAEAGGARARRRALGGQGADSCRRPRQGRRREGGRLVSIAGARIRRSSILGMNLVTHQTGPGRQGSEPALH